MGNFRSKEHKPPIKIVMSKQNTIVKLQKLEVTFHITELLNFLNKTSSITKQYVYLATNSLTI